MVPSKDKVSLTSHHTCSYRLTMGKIAKLTKVTCRCTVGIFIMQSECHCCMIIEITETARPQDLLALQVRHFYKDLLPPQYGRSRKLYKIVGPIHIITCTVGCKSNFTHRAHPHPALRLLGLILIVNFINLT